MIRSWDEFNQENDLSIFFYTLYKNENYKLYVQCKDYLQCADSYFPIREIN